ncbi:MAG: hypothetical protein F4039_02285 [Gammaproteobacteria bacterium]|nr:hypothetical protein [Gammaproteobacteria bacterium]MYF53860.1 hypothetical protein [Gammaproteobacteria bacterium]MYK42903.1 hypothetical protein [Gammaproteobacteria bacterium]
MKPLSVEKVNLLEHIGKHKDLAPMFFSKAEGIEWFDELNKRNYFAVEDNPTPHRTTKEGHVLVPFWPVLDYLERTSKKIKVDQNELYGEKFLAILRSVTEFAKREGFSNYRTWWKFSQIISNIPIHLISEGDIEIVEYWLKDPYDTSLVCESIGIHWLPALLEVCDHSADELIVKLVSLLFEVKINTKGTSPSEVNAVHMAIETSLCPEVLGKITGNLGSKLGDRILPILDSRIGKILEFLGNDPSSIIWRPAIEEHEQNHGDDVINLLIDLYRDTLNSLVRSEPEKGVSHVSRLLECQWITLKRLAIHAMDIGFQHFKGLLDVLIDSNFWNWQFKHELWMFLNHHYSSLSEEQKESVLIKIQSIGSGDDNFRKPTLAYKRAGWLAAIKMHGRKEDELYRQCVEMAEAEPKHPSFEGYMESGTVEPASPISVEDLRAMGTSQLVDYLERFEDDGNNFFESPIEGLYATLQETIKASPLSFSQKLSAFDTLHLGYIYQIIEAYREIWIQKESLPWIDLWRTVLCFCERLVFNDEFWTEKETKFSGPMIPNRHGVVGAIASLIESGVKSDDHAFEPKYLTSAKAIVEHLLKNQPGVSFESNDAVFNAINSPKGKCINALISLTLRECRIADKANKEDHSEVWKHYEPLYTIMLSSTKPPSYEVPTLFANYLLNLLYMSCEWTLESLERVFSNEDLNWWRCAMEGYAYVSRFNEDIYEHLKRKGHIVRVLDDDKVHHLAKERAIANICIAYCRGIESLDDDDALVNALIARGVSDELRRAVIRLWKIGKKYDQCDRKIRAFWLKVINNIDLNERVGKEIASHLCWLSELIDHVDDECLKMVLVVAPYAYLKHNDYNMFKWLKKVSKTQAIQACRIWQAMISFSLPVHPKESVRILLKNIFDSGQEGKRDAADIVQTYLKGGKFELQQMLLEIQQDETGDNS